MKPSKGAFTLIELMVVLVIVSVVATFAIPNYTKSVERSHRKDAESNLMVIHAAQQMYAARNDNAYWGTGNLVAINSNLGINVLANGMTYACAAPGVSPPTFSCSAMRSGWTLTITSASTTPACTAGTCP